MAVSAPAQLPGGSKMVAHSYGTLAPQDEKRTQWRKVAMVATACLSALVALSALASGYSSAPTELDEAAALRLAEASFGNTAPQPKLAAPAAGLAQANPGKTASLAATVQPFKSLASTPMTKKNQASMDAQASKEAKAMVDAAFAEAQKQEKQTEAKPKLAVHKVKEQALANLQKKAANVDAKPVAKAQPAVVAVKKPVAKPQVKVVHEATKSEAETQGQRKLELALDGKGTRVSQGGQYIGKDGKVTDDSFLPLAKMFDMSDRRVAEKPSAAKAPARTGKLAAVGGLPGVKVHTKGFHDPFEDVTVSNDRVGKHTLWTN